MLNPELARRIHVWSDPLGAESGAEVWMPDVIAAGAALQPQSAATDFELLRQRTQNVDELVGDGVVPRLAIACYHRPDDLVAITDFVAGLGVDYRW